MFLLFSATSVTAGQWGGRGVAKHTSFTPLRLSAESSSRPLTPSPLCEGGGGVWLRTRTDSGLVNKQGEVQRWFHRLFAKR